MLINEQMSMKEIRQNTKQNITGPTGWATIDPEYTTGQPKLKFEGEDTVSGKPYNYLKSYTPVAGDKVFVLNGLILGNV